MISFFIKKSFFGGWDNLFRLVLANLPFSLLIGGESALASVMITAHGGAPISVVEFLVLAAGYVVISIYCGASAYFVNKIADFESPGFRDFFRGLKATAARSALFGLFASLLCGLILLCIGYYGARGDVLGNLAMGLLFWLGLFCFLAFQWFFAAMVRLEGNLFKLLRKCLLLAVDNLGFSIFIGLWTFLLFLLSGLTAGFVPGPAGIQLALCEALRLRVYKYDWLDKNPGAKRNKIPWKELIAEDEDLVGTRTLRGMIFPWKDVQK